MLCVLFARCLSIGYTHLAGGVDYALERRGACLSLYLESSDGAEDWMRNLNFPSAAYRRDGKPIFFAHRGFLEAFRTLIPKIEAPFADPAVRSLQIVGYSHGAALAVLAHEYAWYHRPDLRGSLLGYGFGCPRVLFGFARRALAERWEGFTVVRNIDDAVTHLPPSALGYYHVGRMVEIGARGRYSRIDAHCPENILCELRRAGL